MVLQTLWTHTDSSQMKICPLTHPDQVFLPRKEGASYQQKIHISKTVHREKFRLQNLGVAEVFFA